MRAPPAWEGRSRRRRPDSHRAGSPDDAIDRRPRAACDSMLDSRSQLGPPARLLIARAYGVGPWRAWRHAQRWRSQCHAPSPRPPDAAVRWRDPAQAGRASAARHQARPERDHAQPRQPGDLRAARPGHNQARRALRACSSDRSARSTAACARCSAARASCAARSASLCARWAPSSATWRASSARRACSSAPSRSRPASPARDSATSRSCSACSTRASAWRARHPDWLAAAPAAARAAVAASARPRRLEPYVPPPQPRFGRPGCVPEPRSRHGPAPERRPHAERHD